MIICFNMNLIFACLYTVSTVFLLFRNLWHSIMPGLHSDGLDDPHIHPVQNFRQKNLFPSKHFPTCVDGVYSLFQSRITRKKFSSFGRTSVCPLTLGSLISGILYLLFGKGDQFCLHCIYPQIVLFCPVVQRSQSQTHGVLLSVGICPLSILYRVFRDLP